MERLLKRAWHICLWLFIVSAAYSLIAILIPPLALLGMYLAFGFLLNLAVFPSGFAVFFGAGIYRLVKYGKEGLVTGIILVSVALVPAVHFGQITWSERSKIVDRAEYVAALPAERADVGSDTAIVFFEDTGKPRCDDFCTRALQHRSVASFVIGYRPARQGRDILDAALYREFRLSKDGSCSDADMEAMSAGRVSNWAPLYRLGGLCITSNDLDTPPDGIWVFQDRNVRDQPRFDFKGRRVEIYHRREGEMRLLLHYEAGYGSYRLFPPIFTTGFISSPPSVKTVWASIPHSYGERTARPGAPSDSWWRPASPIAAEHLIERVTDISFSDDLFPESAMPAVMKAVAELEENYSNIDDREKRDLLRAIRQLLFVKPELLGELEPLILRAIDDGGVTMAVAVGILSRRTVADREAYLPLILRGLEDPTAFTAVVYALLELKVSLSEGDLVRAATTLPVEPENATYPYSKFFKLLDRQGQVSIAALNHLLYRDDYRMNHAAAGRLIRLGRQDMVLARADVFRESLLAYKPDRGVMVHRNAYSFGPGHIILSSIGLEEEAEAILKTKLQDPSLNDTAREQLEIMLGEL